MNAYDFKVTKMDGSEISLEEYKGKVLLIVNTATGCGFTPQYQELQALYEEFSSQGLEILDFPCNQFGEQAPGENEEIHSFCTGRFGITFPQFAKIDVNGAHAIPLYRWLTEHTRFNGFGMSPMGIMLSGIVKKIDPQYKNNGAIKWNFTKFVINRSGEIAARLEPTDMKSLRDAIKSCL